jgi:hypothetical protein
MVSVIINHLENFFKNNKIGYQLSENIFSFTDPVNEGNEFPIYIYGHLPICKNFFHKFDKLECFHISELLVINV